MSLVNRERQVAPVMLGNYKYNFKYMLQRSTTAGCVNVWHIPLLSQSPLVVRCERARELREGLAAPVTRFANP